MRLARKLMESTQCLCDALCSFFPYARCTLLFSMAVCGDRRRLQLDNGPWERRILKMCVRKYLIHAPLDSDRTQCKREKDLNFLTVILQSITAPISLVCTLLDRLFLKSCRTTKPDGVVHWILSCVSIICLAHI